MSLSTSEFSRLVRQGVNACKSHQRLTTVKPVYITDLPNDARHKNIPNIMIDEYIATKQQVILTSTLKDEEYQTGNKYYSNSKVNAINYEENTTSKILNSHAAAAFMDIVASFGIAM